MSDRGDALFIEMAVAKGYLDRARAEEALSTERATEEDGAGRRFLRDILVDEGWMTEGQVVEVDAQIENGVTHTGRIAGYRVLSKIGRGGMGTVYKAEREDTGEFVALKVLPRKMAEKGDFVERFLREARAASKIGSEHIVKTVDVGFSGGYYYFAMEYVEGESVDTTISIDGAMDELKATHIAHQMALALRDAEQAGMVHRDIKPGNVIVSEDGFVKLTDFGLAREITDDSTAQAGLTLGTPNYMSPEQARAVGLLDIRSDIYSLGVTFYHMVTGAVPFHGETSLLTMLKHLNEQPVAPMTRRPGLSQNCNDVILKMLAKDRADRYRTAGDLAADLALLMEGKPPQYAESTRPVPESAEEKPEKAPSDAGQFAQEIRRHGRVRWLKTGFIAFLFLLVATVVYFILFTGGEPDREERNGGIRSEAAPRTPLLKGGGPRGWSLSAPGHWTFAEGRASASRNAECVMATGNPAWRDYVFSAKVQPGAAPGTARMLFRWTGDGAGRGYYVELAAGAGKVRLRTARDGKAKTLAESSVNLDGAEWYDVVVEARGKRIRVWLRGREVLGAEDGAYASGGVGLVSVRSGARFGDIVIEVAK